MLYVKVTEKQKVKNAECQAAEESKGRMKEKQRANEERERTMKEKQRANDAEHRAKALEEAIAKLTARPGAQAGAQSFFIV